MEKNRLSAWQAKDREFIWHPYTQMKDCLKFPPVLIERAEGVKLYDAAGNFYYDTISSWWCNVHGHNHPRVKEAVKRQLDTLEHVLFAGFTHQPAIKLAEQLAAIAPGGLKRVFFSDNGSTSVEAALKLSFQYWQNTARPQKRKFVALDYGYHGDTIGAMSVSGIGLFNRVFRPLFFPAYRVPSPYCYRCPMGKKRESCDIACIRPLEELLKLKARQIAGIILEPLILAAGGMIVYPKEYLSRAGELAKKFGVHLIIDEVATGFGRTGKMFASSFTAIRPDFLCLSKGITAGCLSLGATLTTQEVYRAFYADYKEKKTFYHGHTYTANPLACAAGLASLEIFRREHTLEKIRGTIALFHQGLEEFKALPIVGDVRRLGMIGAMELVQDKLSKKRFSAERRIGLEIYRQGLKNKIILRPLGDVVYLFLPLCLAKEELTDILDRTYSAIDEAGG